MLLKILPFFLCIWLCYVNPTFAEINQEDFRHPPQDYSLAPFWFLNGDLKEDKVILQMKEMHDKGIDIVIPHARTGLVQKYLGEEWFAIYSVILSTARELGMKVIIYDEYNWPSGRAGGLIMASHPELKNKQLLCKKYNVQGPGEFKFIENKGTIKYLFIAKDKKEKLHFTRREGLVENNRVLWNIPKGDWVILAFVEGSNYAADLMNLEAVRKFISLTHDEYYKRFSPYFGNTIIGFCFDEPIISSWPDFPLPWSDDLEREFLTKYRYSLTDNLPCLFFDVNDFRKVRKDFYSLISDNFKNNFFCQLSDWATTHGNIFYCGHLMNDDDPYGNLQTSGDIFGLLKNIQVCGFDWGGDNRLPPVTGRVFSSIAELDNKKRVSCEIFAAAGWAFPTRRMKRNVDWAFLLGANMIIPHAFFYTLEGSVQLNDYPPSLFSPQPYWQVFRPFADYVKRCSYILSSSKRTSDIALLYPIKAMMQAYIPLEKGKDAEFISKDFAEICTALFEKKLDFRVISEDLLKNAFVSAGKLRIRENEFSFLILTTLKGLEKETKFLIEKIKRKGIKVYILKARDENASGNMVWIIQDIESTLTDKKKEKKFFKVSKEIYWIRYQSDTKPILFISNQSETLWGEIEFLLADVNFNLWDPLAGEVYSVFKVRRLLIPPLYSFFLEIPITAVVSGDSKPLPDYLLRKADREILIQNEQQMPKIFSNSSDAANFKISFHLPKSVLSQNKIYLELESVYQAAKIFLNNHRIGDVFYSPSFLDITPLLKEDNILELEVYSTFANAISGMHFEEDQNLKATSQRTGDWTKFKKEELEYGLFKPPKLCLFRKSQSAKLK